MINQVSLNAILCDISDSESIYRNIKVIRKYKDERGAFKEDIIPCMMWTRDNKNALFSYKSGSLVSISGRIEVLNNFVHIVVEQISYLGNGNFNYICNDIGE